MTNAEIKPAFEPLDIILEGLKNALDLLLTIFWNNPLFFTIVAIVAILFFFCTG